MKFFYLIFFCLVYPINSFALEFSCIDKKYNRFSKMVIENQILKYEDEKNEPAEYKVVENSEKILMAISKGSKDNDPILNYVFVIKDKSLAFNTILRSIKNSYNEIYTNDSILKCIGNEWLNLINYWFNFEKLAWLKC